MTYLRIDYCDPGPIRALSANYDIDHVPNFTNKHYLSLNSQTKML